MRSRINEKQRAILLRREGLSYKEISAKLGVAKSSLSVWLQNIPFSEEEKRALRNRKDANISRGLMRAAATHTRNRLQRETLYFAEAKGEFKRFLHEILFHIGIALYWAEGTKRSNQFLFMNSDEEMIVLMLKWLELYAESDRSLLRYRLYIHKPYAHEDLEEIWAKKMCVTTAQFGKTIYKPTALGIKRRPSYKGCMRIEVPKSKKLLCKMRFWQSLQVEHFLKR